MIDDLQWSDADSILLLGELLRQPEAPGLLIVATLRHGTEHSAKLLQKHPSAVRRMDLGRLTAIESLELECPPRRR